MKKEVNIIHDEIENIKKEIDNFQNKLKNRKSLMIKKTTEDFFKMPTDINNKKQLKEDDFKKRQKIQEARLKRVELLDKIKSLINVNHKFLAHELQQQNEELIKNNQNYFQNKSIIKKISDNQESEIIGLNNSNGDLVVNKKILNNLKKQGKEISHNFIIKDSNDANNNDFILNTNDDVWISKESFESKENNNKDLNNKNDKEFIKLLSKK